MRGGTSSGLRGGYSTFLRLRSDGRCCGKMGRGVEMVSLGSGVTRRACSALTRGSESRDATRYAAVRRGEMIRAWKAQIRVPSTNPARACLRASVSGFRAVSLDRIPV